MDSILDDIKKVIGIEPSATNFDTDLVMHINSTFYILNQLGVGPDDPFTVVDSSSKWDDFITDTSIDIIKSYMYLRVRLLFDPPANSFVVDSINKQINEFEWRMQVGTENKKVT